MTQLQTRLTKLEARRGMAGDGDLLDVAAFIGLLNFLKPDERFPTEAEFIAARRRWPALRSLTWGEFCDAWQSSHEAIVAERAAYDAAHDESQLRGMRIGNKVY